MDIKRMDLYIYLLLFFSHVLHASRIDGLCDTLTVQWCSQDFAFGG